MVFFIFIILTYVTINFFVWRGTVHWLMMTSSFLHNRWFKVLFTIVYAFLAASPASWLLVKNTAAEAVIKFISNVWIGIAIYILFFVTLAFITSALLRCFKVVRKGEGRWNRFVVVRGAVVALLVISFSAYGFLHVGNIKTTKYQVEVDKAYKGRDNLRIVLVADMHMGYSIGEKQIHGMVEKINAQNPDLVCIAGDIFDNDFKAVQGVSKLANEYRRIKSKLGVYACYGNHDIAENLVGGFNVPGNKAIAEREEMDAFLQSTNIKLLEDKAVLVDDAFYLVGRRDFLRPGTESGQRKGIESLTTDMDKSKSIIVMDHEPKELQETADAGADLDLSGHTHDGQIFPGNLLMPFIWENPCGYLKKDDMHSIVTSGVGIWGPAMRVGTDSEIVVIDVAFNPSYQTQK